MKVEIDLEGLDFKNIKEERLNAEKECEALLKIISILETLPSPSKAVVVRMALSLFEQMFKDESGRNRVCAEILNRIASAIEKAPTDEA